MRIAAPDFWSRVYWLHESSRPPSRRRRLHQPHRYVVVGSLLGRVLGDTSYGQLAVFNEVVRLVLEAYVEPVNLDRAMAGARLGLTDALDGDSAYLDDEELKLYNQTSKDDADVGLLLSRRGPFLMVVSTRAGSPAEKAGMKAG